GHPGPDPGGGGLHAGAGGHVQALQGPRLRRLQRHRVQGASRALRGDGDDGEDPRPHHDGRDLDRGAEEGAGGGDAHPAYERAGEDQAGQHDDRGSAQGNRPLGGSDPMAVSLHQLLKTMTEMGGSDLHVTTNSPPQIRVDGKLRPLDLPPLTAVDTKQLAYSVLTDAQKR